MRGREGRGSGKKRRGAPHFYNEVYAYVQNRCILIPLLRLTLLVEGFPWDDVRKILHGVQRMSSVHSSKEILPKASTP